SPFDFWGSAAPWLTLIALGFTVVLLHARAQERATYLNTLWLFFVGIGGEAAASIIWGLNFTEAASTVHAISRFVASIALIRQSGFMAFRLFLPLIGSHPPRIAEDLTIVAVYVIYGFAQLRGAGLDLSSIVTTSAILTAVVAFAMQDTLGNVLAGLAVQLDNSVRIGDWIKVDHVSGRVRVIAIIDDEMRELSIPNVARTPSPSCVLKAFDEGNLCYQLRYFLMDIHEDDLTDSMVRVHLFASLQRAGIRIAEPQRTTHAVTRDQAHAETVRRRELTRRLEALATVPPFAALPEETRADIAERLQYAPFARGDVITKQGNKAHWLYILAFDEAE